MAEGFVEHSQRERVLEEVGDDYFVELLSRSIIQQSYDDDRGEKFVMHDLVNDLATVVSGKSCCKLECGGNISENVRHLSYNQEKYDIFKKFEICHDFKCLRSFIAISPYWLRNSYLSRRVVHDFLPTLKRLRVLSLSHYTNITMLPDSVGSLVQLRYLDLSYTGIKSLPDTTCNLYNLQTLILSCCNYLTELPMHMGKLVNLRHLDISGTNIKEMPLQIVGLENLQTLTIFIVGKREAGLSVRELRRFPNLRRKLCVKNLHNVIDAMEANDANLKSKEQIEKLKLEWGKQTKDSQTEKVVLDMLQPSVNLKKLTIDSYGGTTFPSWFGYSSFSNMVSLSIENCENCVTLPPLGQLPSLKKLHIEGMTILDTIGPEFYGMEGGGSNSSFQPFPSIEELKFENMSNWKAWLPFEGGKFPFPCLKSLKLYYCPKLKGHLPSHLSSIEKIKIDNCDYLLATPPTLHWLSSIKYLNIQGNFITRQNTESTQWSLLGSDSSCLLPDVWMGYCDTLLSLPIMNLRSNCLQHLVLSTIPSLTAFPADGLPTSLQSLDIDSCENLAFLPPETWSNYTSLVNLKLLDSCDALTSFPLDGFPALETLSIDGCKSLESIVILESSSLHPHPPTLQSLTVSRCKTLRSLTQRMDTLTALERLRLYNLPELELSLFEGAFLPPKLRHICIESGKITTPVTEWDLQRLTALSIFGIGGDDIVKTLLKERLLPNSLVSLTIYNLSKMKSFKGNGIRHLSSLEELEFRNCPGLESLSEDTLPSSLETLKFVDCPRLESLPEDRLPSSLKLLKIWNCPMLEARHESERGQHWSNIAHIPVVKINTKVTI